MKCLSVIVLLLVAACGEDLPSYITAKGVRVYTSSDMTFPEEDANKMDSWLASWLPGGDHGSWYNDWCVNRAQRMASVHFVSGPFYCGTIKAAGCENYEHLDVTWSSNPFHTAYVHEMIHAAQEVCASPWRTDIHHEEQTVSPDKHKIWYELAGCPWCD